MDRVGPLADVAFAALLEQGWIGFDQPVVDVLDPSSICREDVTVGDLLLHRAGLGSPTASEWRMAPVAEREALIPPAPEPGPAYSELVAGLLLESIVTTVTGLAPARYVEVAVTQPMGIADDLFLHGPRLLERGARRRVRTPVKALRGGRVVPLVSERMTREIGRELRPAFGAYATIGAIGRWFHSGARCWNGEPAAGLPHQETVRQALAMRRGEVFDASLRRVCDFGPGVMVGLTGHGAVETGDQWEPAVFHLAGITNAFCVTFLGPCATLGVYFDGISADRAAMVRARTQLVEAFWREL